VSHDLFVSIRRCWVCDHADLFPINEERLNLENLLADPNLEPVFRPYHGLTFTLNRCWHCDFMQPACLPSHPRFFDALYDLDWSRGWMEQEFSSGYKDAIFQTILGELGRRLPMDKRSLLDVGTHVGRMLHLARNAGWQAEGIERNPRTAAFAAERTGLPIHRMNIMDLAAIGIKDAVVLTDVLEHIPDPVSVLRQVRSLLKAGGWVAVKVPCGTSQLFKQRLRHWCDTRHDPGIATNYVHVNHFGARSLATALRRAGFDFAWVGVGTPEFSPGGGVKGVVSRLFRSTVYTASRLIPWGTRTVLTMNLQAYARNRE
jgi:SAM-dependent methyltransferase